MKKLAMFLAVVVIVGWSLPAKAADFDGDGTNDISIFRSSSGLWAVRGVTRAYFGGSSDETVPGDYDGDGTSEIGIFRELSGLWAIRGVTRAYFGGFNDEPVYAGGGGIKGPKGDTGDAGPKGDTGDTGPPGPVAGSNGQIVYNDNGTAAGADVYYDNSTGNFAIGTTNTDTPLLIKGKGYFMNSTAQGIEIADSAGALIYAHGSSGNGIDLSDCAKNFIEAGSGESSFTVQSTGYVGLGIEDPEYRFHLKSGDWATAWIENTQGGGTALVVRCDNGAGGDWAIDAKATSGLAGKFTGDVDISGDLNVTGTDDGDWAIHATATSGLAGKFTGDVDITGTVGGDWAIHARAGTGLAGNFTGDVDISGDLNVVGAVNKSGGTFKIDHPLDPENKYLFHSFVESPDMKNIYDGVVELNGAGEATVELPVWFEALNRDFRYQLTCIGGYAPVYISEEISGNSFQIAGGESGTKVSWQVTGIRHDRWAEANRISVEEDKPAHELGSYLHPKEWGQPPAKAVGKLR